ncbi:MAG: sigma-70 family RNA polymerase sigma factor [Planctomycetota bacterium]
MTAPAPQPDPVLPLVARGEAGAADALLERYGGLVWSLACRMTATREEAEDAVQEIFVEVVRSSRRFDPAVAGEATFVAMIARRRLVDHLRRRSRRIDAEPLAELHESDGSIAGGVALPDEDHRQHLSEEARRALAAMDRLSDAQRHVILLSAYRGLSHERIAAATGMPLGTVKAHIRRGMLRLRELLGAESAGRSAP